MRRQWNSAIPMHAELRAESLLSASLMQEFIAANIVVVGAPMHNYFTPSTLKAWLDRLLHLHEDMAAPPSSQRVMLVTSGWGADDPQQAELMQGYEGQLKAAFKSIGVRHLDVARAGMN
jgi:FMN-dependent NADH-azoreductase